MNKTLILIGGWARDKRTYRKLINCSPDDWKIVVIPYRDFIVAEVNDKTEEKLLKIVEKQEGKVYLAGHSLGGEPCIKFASKYPDKIEGLFLLDSCGVKVCFTAWRVFWNFMTMYLGYSIFKLREDLLSVVEFLKHPILYARFIKYFFTIDLEEEAIKITTPTIIFYGERDYVITYDQEIKLHKRIKNSRIIKLKGFDHDWIIHRPKNFWENFEKINSIDEIPSVSTAEI